MEWGENAELERWRVGEAEAGISSGKRGSIWCVASGSLGSPLTKTGRRLRCFLFVCLLPLNSK